MHIAHGFAPIRRRTGFTLIEMLVVLVVISILATISFLAVNATMKADRVSGGAVGVQSFLEGARDRALHDQTPRGVRFYSHPNDERVFTSYQYIGSGGILSQGTVTIEADNRTIAPTPPANGPNEVLQVWNALRNRGLINPVTDFSTNPATRAVARIKIGSNLSMYTMQFDPNAGVNGGWRLTKDADSNLVGTPQPYELYLEPAVLPNQERRDLPDGVVMDASFNQNLAVLSQNDPETGNVRWFDVMFTPQGMMIGPNANRSHLHLVFRDIADFDANRTLAHPDNENGVSVVTITTRTGSVSNHSIFDDNDPFRYAETGVETK